MIITSAVVTTCILHILLQNLYLNAKFPMDCVLECLFRVDDTQVVSTEDKTKSLRLNNVELQNTGILNSNVSQ